MEEKTTQPPVTTPAAPQTPPASEKKGLAIASMVLGIVAWVLCCFWYLLSPVGLILGIVSLQQKQGGRGMAIAGVVLCGLSVLFGISGLIFGNALLNNMPDFMQGL